MVLEYNDERCLVETFTKYLNSEYVVNPYGYIEINKLDMVPTLPKNKKLGKGKGLRSILCIIIGSLFSRSKYDFDYKKVARKIAYGCESVGGKYCNPQFAYNLIMDYANTGNGINKYGISTFIDVFKYSEVFRMEDVNNIVIILGLDNDRFDDPEYSACVKKTLEKYDYKCDICGAKTKQVHHKNGYAEFPEQRNDVDNCVPLCKDCHAKYHLKYGYSGITEDKYLIFKEKELTL